MAHSISAGRAGATHMWANFRKPLTPQFQRGLHVAHAGPLDRREDLLVLLLRPYPNLWMAMTEAPPAVPIAPLRIEGPMTLERAIELRDTLLAALERGRSPVQFDLSDVTELDSAGVQLLLLAKRTASARNMELSLMGQSPTVVRTLELLRLDAYFGAPVFFLFGEDP